MNDRKFGTAIGYVGHIWMNSLSKSVLKLKLSTPSTCIINFVFALWEERAG